MKSFAAVALLVLTAACAPKPAANDAQMISDALRNGCKAVEARDVEGMIAPFLKEDPDKLEMFDFATPRSRGYAKLKQANADFVANITGQPVCQYLSIKPVILSPDAAYSVAIMRAAGTLKSGQSLDFTIRSTDVWRKVDGQWKIVHEHNSFPVDMATGVPDFQSKE
ncbi:MAG: nuclear transport factor 2 family protein [Caulobacterales bacterium]